MPWPTILIKNYRGSYVGWDRPWFSVHIRTRHVTSDFQYYVSNWRYLTAKCLNVTFGDISSGDRTCISSALWINHRHLHFRWQVFFILCWQLGEIIGLFRQLNWSFSILKWGDALHEHRHPCCNPCHWMTCAIITGDSGRCMGAWQLIHLLL